MKTDKHNRQLGEKQTARNRDRQAARRTRLSDRTTDGQTYNDTTFGILVIPPTNKTSLMSLFPTSASFSAFSQGATVLPTRSDTRDSNFDLVSWRFMCLGPDASIVRKGRLMSVWEGGNGLGGVEGKRSGVRGGSRVIGWNMTAAHSTFIPSHIPRPV